MKLSDWMRQLSLSLSAFCFITAAQAGIPVWSFNYNPYLPPQTTVTTTGTTTVQYIVTNNSEKSHHLVIKPQQSVTQSSTCFLGPKGSVDSTCMLTLTINGSEVPSHGLFGGPTLCQANEDGSPNPNECYRPSKENSLAIKAMMPCTRTSGAVPPMPVNGNALTTDSNEFIANCPGGYNVICKLSNGVTDAYCINQAENTGDFSSLPAGLALLNLTTTPPYTPFTGKQIPESVFPSCIPTTPANPFSFPSSDVNVCAACNTFISNLMPCTTP